MISTTFTWYIYVKLFYYKRKHTDPYHFHPFTAGFHGHLINSMLRGITVILQNVYILNHEFNDVLYNLTVTVCITSR